MSYATLSALQRAEPVTKGYLEDVLNEKNYVTKDYLVDTVAGIMRVLENIVKKFDRIDQRFEMIDKQFGKIDRRFEMIDKQFGKIDQRFEKIELDIKKGVADVNRHTSTLKEYYDDKILIMGEGQEFRIEKVERRVDALEIGYKSL